jgi:hypothetical protein
MAIFKTSNSIADDVVEIAPKPVKKIKVFGQNESKKAPKCPYHEEHKRNCVDCEKV